LICFSISKLPASRLFHFATALPPAVIRKKKAPDDAGAKSDEDQ
jgi:hypothetical protein